MLKPKLERLKLEIHRKTWLFKTRDLIAKMLCSSRLFALFCSVFSNGTQVYETQVPLGNFFFFPGHAGKPETEMCALTCWETEIKKLRL